MPIAVCLDCVRFSDPSRENCWAGLVGILLVLDRDSQERVLGISARLKYDYLTCYDDGFYPIRPAIGLDSANKNGVSDLPPRNRTSA